MAGQQCIGAIGTAVLVLISKASGEEDENQIKKLSQQALLLALVSGVVMEIISLLLCPYIPAWMGGRSCDPGTGVQVFSDHQRAACIPICQYNTRGGSEGSAGYKDSDVYKHCC